MTKPEEEIDDVFAFLDSSIKTENPKYSKMLQDLEKTKAELDTRIKLLNKSALVSETDTKGIITYANKKFCEVSQYKLEELIGQTHNIIRHPDMPSEAFKGLWATIGRGEVWQGEVKNKAKDGTPYWVIATIAPVLGNDGKPAKYISVRYDITEQKLREQAINTEKEGVSEELLENIQYTKKIHDKILQTEEEFQTILSNSFIYYKAKMKLSGDFYWFRQVDHYVHIALGDSTGYGVAAAFTSMIVMHQLINLLHESDTFAPSNILEKVDSNIVSVFDSDEEGGLSDSIDIGLYNYNLSKKTLEYASANLDAVVLRNGKLTFLEKDDISVGGVHYKTFYLEENTIQLQAGDKVYLFTDGILREFSDRNDMHTEVSIQDNLWITVIEEIGQHDFAGQKVILDSLVERWVSQYNLLDDILVLGFEVE